MKRNLIFSKELKDKFDNVDYDDDIGWKNNGISNTDDLMKKIIQLLNEKYIKLNIMSYEFRDEVVVYNESSTYFGIIENSDETIEGYAFVIPPAYATRSGVLAQQVFPVISGIMQYCKNSNDKKIINRPVYIINANEVSQTPSMVVNILSGEILEFKYIDVFNRDLGEILRFKGMKERANNLAEYDEWLINLNKGNVNEYFELDKDNKIIRYLPIRLKDGIHVNNEPYWFVLKAYASFYLALKEGYKCDMSKFDILQIGNKTLDAFRDYIKRFE